MAFIILPSTFSLFATNILKLYLVICAATRLHGMPLLFLNQFLACSAGARILLGKHSVAFILLQLGGVLISRTSLYTVVPSLQVQHKKILFHTIDLYRQAKYLARQFGNDYSMLNSTDIEGLRKPG